MTSYGVGVLLPASGWENVPLAPAFGDMANIKVAITAHARIPLSAVNLIVVETKPFDCSLNMHLP